MSFPTGGKSIERNEARDHAKQYNLQSDRIVIQVFESDSELYRCIARLVEQFLEEKEIYGAARTKCAEPLYVLLAD